MSKMSSVTANSNKQEKTRELIQEVESVRAMNESLHVYLEHLRTFRRNLITVNENCKQLNKVNTQWIDLIDAMK